MIVQDLTRFLLVAVVLGIILAIAIFRPEILPAETNLVVGQEESDMSSLWELEQRERELDQRETRLDQRQHVLDQRQAELDRHRAGLDHRQAGLDEREVKLEEQMAALRVRKDQLTKQGSLLDEEQNRLREKGAYLAEWEQKLEGRQRFSVVALALSGFLSVPSVVVLVALIRRSQPTW